MTVHKLTKSLIEIFSVTNRADHETWAKLGGRPAARREAELSLVSAKSKIFVSDHSHTPVSVLGFESRARHGLFSPEKQAVRGRWDF